MIVSFPVPAEVAFDYLADPANRPTWQSSLARVTDISGAVGVGQTWIDVTKPGPRPRMRTTVYERARRWAEAGEWRGVTATLTLDFADRGATCDVAVSFDLSGAGVRRLPLALLRPVAPLAVRADLRQAARLLADPLADPPAGH